MSFFLATGTPVLDFWWRLLWVSKPEWVLPYSLFSGTTPANLLMASTQPVTSPHTSAEVGLGLGLNVQSPTQNNASNMNAL